MFSVSSSIEPENRYILKIPEGETLYMANEISTPLSRLFCGSKRRFHMSLMDHTRQQALVLNRRTAFSFFCLPCIVQVNMYKTKMTQIINAVFENLDKSHTY